MAGPQRAATEGGAAAHFESKGLDRLMSHGSGSRDKQVDQRHGHIEFGVISAQIHVTY